MTETVSADSIAKNKERYIDLVAQRVALDEEIWNVSKELTNEVTEKIHSEYQSIDYAKDQKALLELVEISQISGFASSILAQWFDTFDERITWMGQYSDEIFTPGVNRERKVSFGEDIVPVPCISLSEDSLVDRSLMSSIASISKALSVDGKSVSFWVPRPDFGYTKLTVNAPEFLFGTCDLDTDGALDVVEVILQNIRDDKYASR